MYKLTTKTEHITESCVIEADGFSGWRCINLGSDDVVVNGMPLMGADNYGYDKTNHELKQDLDFMTFDDKDVVWDEPIKVIFSYTPSTTRDLLLIRNKYIKI